MFVELSYVPYESFEDDSRAIATRTKQADDCPKFLVELDIDIFENSPYHSTLVDVIYTACIKYCLR
jgi:hypothetical protein